MTGILVKFLLLLILVSLVLKKFLRWAAQSKGPYGKLASDTLRLVDDFGRGLSRTIFWSLVLALILLMSRRVLTQWLETKEKREREAVEQVQSPPPDVR